MKKISKSMKPRKSIKGLEQLLYPRNSSLNSAPGGLILDRIGAHQIMRQLADTHLQPQSDMWPQSDLQPQSDLSSSDSDIEVDFFPKSNDYWDLDSESEEYDPARWRELAVTALKYYHEKQGVELKLNGEISAFPLHYDDGIGFHLDFQANDSTGSPKKIFAEVFQFDKSGECRVLFCDIMDPIDPDLFKGCRFCSPLVLHPKGIKFFKRPFEWSDASV